MRRKESVMRCLNIAMVLVVALHSSGRRCELPDAGFVHSITISGDSAVDEPAQWGSTPRGGRAVVRNADGLTRAFLYTGGSLVDLGTLGGTTASPIVSATMASSGQGAGFVGPVSRIRDDVHRRSDRINALNPRADGDFGAALGVNSVGDVAGYYLTEGDHMSARNRVFYYRDFRVEDLGAFGGEDGVVVAVNDRGSLAGFFSSEPHADYAEHRSFLFTRGKLVPISRSAGS